MRRVLWLTLAVGLVALFGACRGGAAGGVPTGTVKPTVAGSAGAGFEDPAAARRAFTRSAGSLTATLEDASWLRFEGAPDAVAKAHRAYFDYGYTTFQVQLSHNDFVQPTSEVFVLEDSTGARQTGKPTAFKGSPVLERGRYVTTFSLSFPHVLTGDIRWIRLSWPRAANGSVLEWRFE